MSFLLNFRGQVNGPGPRAATSDAPGFHCKSTFRPVDVIKNLRAVYFFRINIVIVIRSFSWFVLSFLHQSFNPTPLEVINAAAVGTVQVEGLPGAQIANIPKIPGGTRKCPGHQRPSSCECTGMLGSLYVGVLRRVTSWSRVSKCLRVSRCLQSPGSKNVCTFHLLIQCSILSDLAFR